MKKLVAAMIVVSLLMMACGTVGAASAGPKFIMNGKQVTDKPLNSKGEYYFRTAAAEKLFGIKLVLDAKKKKAALTVNKKQVQLELLVANKQYYVSISRLASLLKVLVRYDKSSNAYYLIKQRSAAETQRALQTAWKTKDLNLMRELVLSGTKLDLDRTLFLASTNNGIEIAEYLISQGADIDYVDPVSGNQTLTNAIARGYEDFAVKMIVLGADVHYGPQYRWTNLHYAVSEQQIKVVEALLQHGADPNVGYYGRYGRDPETPLELAASKVQLTDENGKTGVRMPNAAIIALLLKFGASPANDDSLANAVRAEAVEAVELLLKAGADPNRKNEAGETLMTSAGIDPSSEIGKLLVKGGASAQSF
ncbi:ankyrin repeat domain-containing protein [Cohnella sp. GCM10027633]|uniref:ankyrin repeat domain-containing protein n=1 Tax=unclassified Cohnella TaxID=2636738 RepID=UPI00362CD3BD